MHVVEINEIERLLAYQGEWDCLLSETHAASFFQTLEWLACYWRHFGSEQQLRTLLVYDGDTLVGIVPLVVRLLATRAGSVRTLTYPLDEWGTCFGPIGPNPAATLVAALIHIQQSSRDWDVIDVNWVAEPDRDAVNDAFRQRGIRPQSFTRPELSLIDLTQPWGAYWDNLSVKHRSNIRRAEKKLAKAGAVELLRYQARVGDDPTEHWDLYDMCETVAATSWQSDLATGTTLTHERVRPFLRDAFAAAVRVGAASLYVLTVGGTPAAFSSNYVFRGSEFGLRMGYVASLRDAGPGTVLFHRMLQVAFASDRHTFDLGEGDSPYKHLWRTRAMPSYRFCYYAKTSLRAQALRFKRHWSGELNSRV